jgi:hypothetical protein
MDTINIVHAEIVGVNAQSQFRGWVLYKRRTISKNGVSVSGVKKLWVDFFN